MPEDKPNYEIDRTPGYTQSNTEPTITISANTKEFNEAMQGAEAYMGEGQERGIVPLISAHPPQIPVSRERTQAFLRKHTQAFIRKHTPPPIKRVEVGFSFNWFSCIWWSIRDILCEFKPSIDRYERFVDIRIGPLTVSVRKRKVDTDADTC